MPDKGAARPDPGAGHHPGGDRGSGLIGTSLALVVFFTMLLGTTQVLLSLHATTSVNAAAHDGARIYAGAIGGHDDAGARAAAKARAEDQIRSLVPRAQIDWSGSSVEWVQVTVNAPAPRIALGGFGSGEITRTVRVRTERLQ